MARPQKFRHSRETLNDPQIAAKLGGLVLDIETLRMKRKQIDDQIAAAYDAVDDAGFEKKFVRKTIALRAKEEGARADEEQGLEAYEIAIEKGVSLACARRERNLPPHDPITGELTDTQEQPETPTPHSPSATPRADAVAAAPRPQAATAPIPHSAEVPTAADKPETAVTPLPAVSGEIPEGTPAFLLKERKPLRPNCLHPENCAGYGSHTCHSCTRAMTESEAA